MSLRLIARLSEEDKKNLKKGVIEVEGKAMNRTALGIVAAIFKLYPNVTYAELKEMLPDRINLSAPKNFKHGYMPYTDLPYGVVQRKELVEKLCNENKSADGKINATHFTEPDEMFKTSDGVTVCVAKLWETKDTVTGQYEIQNLIDHVVQYGIRVVSFESVSEAFKRGEYVLRVINPQLMEKIHKVQKSPVNNTKIIIIATLALIVISILTYFVLRDKKEIDDKKISINKEESIEKKRYQKKDIVNIEEKLQKGESVKDMSINFHNILFRYDSNEILTESEKDLKEACDFLQKYPNIKVKIVGHTSLEGTEEYNQKLSERRAKAVKEYLVSKGIQEQRLSYEGMGEKKPLSQGTDDESNKLNRRTEFIIIEE